ncbi:hypothetical protein SEA_SYRA333_2 [Mycobacterium phage Syra333]|nr:hypothetical protein SEA_SYRA333_2 [Mycobacterium phage Syra333]
MTPEDRLALAREALDSLTFEHDDTLNPIVLHALVSIGELLSRLDARQAAQAAQLAQMGAQQ